MKSIVKFRRNKLIAWGILEDSEIDGSKVIYSYDRGVYFNDYSKESVAKIKSIIHTLSPSEKLIIQTIHPNYTKFFNSEDKELQKIGLELLLKSKYKI